jgi:hypothetical protein
MPPVEVDSRYLPSESGMPLAPMNRSLLRDARGRARPSLGDAVAGSSACCVNEAQEPG